ncbi:hypothetical protein H6F90_16795 [Trichocoleus sp. FACHB-591]|uniref:glycosyltransferase n=1 Tax=Trichocoleus sp. FACHB-591 TaxID=2692872 RepID=UPI001689061B|nr:glycosyltransferase [Trichocoleus sp. FACHB-591]MBD2096763.1 hypothetical protein [Trichocoleus sp. FACHB-591]
MSSFQHFLITRINIDWNISKPRSQQERNNIDFLKYRLDIFEKTCYPSVKAQTEKKFTWLILLDAELPSIFRERIQSYCSHSNIEILPVYISSKENCLSELKAAISEKTLKTTTHIITTNLDSDDAVSRKFISTIQNQFREQDSEFINFPFGYLYQLKEQKAFLREWLTAPCYTLIEDHKNFETVLKYGHDQISNYKVYHVFTTPMWLMTAHNMNVRTKFDVAAAWQPTNRVSEEFCINLELPKKRLLESSKEFFTESLNVVLSRRSWDTPKVKFRKIVNIFSPFLIRLARRAQYSQKNQSLSS